VDVSSGGSAADAAAAEAVRAFLKAFRISLNYALLYSSEHASFRRSVEELKRAIDALQRYVHPIEIAITPDSLRIGRVVYDKGLINQELAGTLHSRKIKRIRIEPEATARDLALLVEKISLPPKVIVKSGGVSRMLSEYPRSSFEVEDLDYSQLLRDAGEQIKDVWSYLFKKALATPGGQDLEQYADSFDEIIDGLSGQEIVQSKELMSGLHGLLGVLKRKDEAKYRRSVSKLVGKLVGDRRIVPAELEEMRTFFLDVGETELADALWGQILENKDFDSYNFGLFAALVENDKHSGVADSVKERMREAADMPQVAERVKALFTLSESRAFISSVYRSALMSSLQGLGAGQQPKLSLDREQMATNYHSALLNLLDIESDSGRLSAVVDKLLTEWNQVVKRNDLQYFRDLWSVVERKRDTVADLRRVERELSQVVEGMLLGGAVSDELAYFVDRLRTSAVGPAAYLERIFAAEPVHPWILKLFFRLFPGHFEGLCRDLVKRRDDMGFIWGLVQSLKAVDVPETLETLKRIYAVTNEFVRLEVLEAMSGLAGRDKEFLRAVTSSGSYFIKREAVRVLIRDEAGRRAAADALLSMRTRFGWGSRALLENIGITAEVDLREAVPHLAALSRRRYVWNRRVRGEARKLLRSWGAEVDRQR